VVSRWAWKASGGEEGVLEGGGGEGGGEEDEGGEAEQAGVGVELAPAGGEGGEGEGVEARVGQRDDVVQALIQKPALRRRRGGGGGGGRVSGRAQGEEHAGLAAQEVDEAGITAGEARGRRPRVGWVGEVRDEAALGFDLARGEEAELAQLVVGVHVGGGDGGDVVAGGSC